jgi:hypothetical protein
MLLIIVVSIEMLFNLLKIIEYYDRISIGQSRLQDLATQDKKTPTVKSSYNGY